MFSSRWEVSSFTTVGAAVDAGNAAGSFTGTAASTGDTDAADTEALVRTAADTQASHFLILFTFYTLSSFHYPRVWPAAETKAVCF